VRGRNFDRPRNLQSAVPDLMFQIFRLIDEAARFFKEQPSFIGQADGAGCSIDEFGLIKTFELGEAV